jgi:hypothetical protein
MYCKYNMGKVFYNFSMSEALDIVLSRQVNVENEADVEGAGEAADGGGDGWLPST